MAHAPQQLTLGPLLGRGGYGEVYLASLKTTGGLQSSVAVKVLRDGNRPGAAERLKDEARLLFGIRHPSVVTARDFVWVEGRPALVTEFIPGMDLAQLIGDRVELSERSLLDIGVAVASALEAAWTGAHGGPGEVVHRDIKPSNLRVGRHGDVSVLDFGIARFEAEGRQANTQTDVLVGSAPYMAPERFSSRSSGPQVDVFGLGCCLYETMAKRRFNADSLRDVTTRSLSRDAFDEHLAAQVEALDRPGSELSDLLIRMLAYEPRERPRAGELVDRLEELASRAPGSSLKRWCSDRDWPPAADEPGPLTGRVVVGRGQRHPPPPVPVPAPPPDVRNPADNRPRVVRVAPITYDPAMEPTVENERSADEVETEALQIVLSTPAATRPTHSNRGLVLVGCLFSLAVALALTSAGVAVAVLRMLS